MRKLTQEEFIEKSKAIHGDLYDYSDTVYINAREDVTIKCNRCGEYFTQKAINHLVGRGCNKCARKNVGVKRSGHPNYNAKRLIFGVGINDLNVCARGNKCYEIWHSILQRTVCEKKVLSKCYCDAEVCDEWLVLSNFKKWFDENYVEGWNIDKDLLCNGRKIYSPETCVFLPEEINSSITREKVKRDLPIGVMRHKNRFKAVCRLEYLGLFDTVDDAKKAYLKAKKKRIIELANKWKDKLEPRVYDALINLDVDKFFNNK